MNKKRAVFIDRDGVVVRAIFRKGFEFPTAPFSFAELSFFEGIDESLVLLKEMGFLRILATNQPDVGYGNISKEEWNKIQNKVEEFSFDDVFICHHIREAVCACKKPKPGMLLAAAEKWNIDLKNSYIIGDTEKDMDAGLAAGCKRILIRTDYNQKIRESFEAVSFLSAVKLIQLIEKGGIK